MSTDIAHADDDTGLDILPAAPGGRSAASIQLAQQVQDMKNAATFARSMCYTSAVPDIYKVGSRQNSDRKDEDVIANAAAAIIYGNELGITAGQALQNIFSVGGKPAIYARTAVALLTRQGYKIATKSKSETSVTVVGVAPDGRSEESTWTIERATLAGYVPTIDEKTGEYRKNKWNKLIGNEKYLTDPVTMLKAKAQMEVCRDLAPDVLMGFSADDPETAVRDEEQPRKVRNEAAPAVDPMAELRARLGSSSAIAAPKPAPEPEVPATEAAEAVGESTESDTAAPSKDDMRRLNHLFDRAGIGWKSAADKAKKKTVIEKLIERTVENDTPLTADECLKVVGQLEALVVAGENSDCGDAVLVDTVTGLVEEDQPRSEES